MDNEPSNLENRSDFTQYLTFSLGEEEYAVDILKVQEIRGWEPVSKVPGVPDYEVGVINLRGAIVPIVDLRDRFGLYNPGYTPFTTVIVLQIHSADGFRVVGAAVDSVSDVVTVTSDAVQLPPKIGTHINIEFISGLTTFEEKLIMLLDVDRLMSMDPSDHPTSH